MLLRVQITNQGQLLGQLLGQLYEVVIVRGLGSLL